MSEGNVSPTVAAFGLVLKDNQLFSEAISRYPQIIGPQIDCTISEYGDNTL